MQQGRPPLRRRPRPRRDVPRLRGLARSTLRSCYPTARRSGHQWGRRPRHSVQHVRRRSNGSYHKHARNHRCYCHLNCVLGKQDDGGHRSGLEKPIGLKSANFCADRDSSWGLGHLHGLHAGCSSGHQFLCSNSAIWRHMGRYGRLLEEHLLHPSFRLPHRRHGILGGVSQLPSGQAGPRQVRGTPENLGLGWAGCGTSSFGHLAMLDFVDSLLSWSSWYSNSLPKWGRRSRDHTLDSTHGHSGDARRPLATGRPRGLHCDVHRRRQSHSCSCRECSPLLVCRDSTQNSS
mmetsp:Transcript_61740/g.130307  ORF Transcript_61740/g.130307 Transcript_61740/m.130307 type:complete len:290 (+) Transcript_61740:1046-1915(+)